MAGKGKKQSWEREDKLLDYIAGHKSEILRYLVVVLAGEIVRWGIGIVCALVPALLPFQAALTFLLWGLPYFIACKLWVWRQSGDNGYVWATQGMKFLMCIFVIAFINMLLGMLLSSLGETATRLLTNIVWEILYFLAMLKIVLKTKKTAVDRPRGQK